MRFTLKDHDQFTVRWVLDARKQERSTLYIHKWRVPADIPGEVDLRVSKWAPNSQTSYKHDVGSLKNPASRVAPIVREAVLGKVCRDTYRYELVPLPNEKDRPLSSVYIPKSGMKEALDRVVIHITWI